MTIIRRQLDVGPVNPGSQDGWEVPVRGPECYCPIVVVCDSPTGDAHRYKLPLDPEHHMWLARKIVDHGFKLGDIKLIGLCPPVPKQDFKSAKRKWQHVEKYRTRVLAKLEELQPRFVVTFGELATRVVCGSAKKITKARGVPVQREDAPPYFPMLSPGFVRRIPDHEPAFDADLAVLSRLKESRYDVTDFLHQEGDYEWVWNIVLEDSGDLLERLRSAPVMAVDTETQGGTRWWDPDVKLLSVQICVAPGEAYVFPVCDDWCGHEHGASSSTPHSVNENYGYDYNRVYLQEILGNPNIRKVGHNIKFEHMMLRKIGIEVQGWLHDTQLMLFNADENLLDKSLDMGVKVYVPGMGGYADELSQNYNKADMASIPRDVFTRYSAGDADATLRLARRLKPLIDADDRHRNCYRRVQLPAILTFANTVEMNGMAVDQDRLRVFAESIDHYLEETYRKLIALTPAAVKTAHLEAGHELKFSRPTFVRDILFSSQGFGLESRVFTESTEDLEPHLREPSTSTKKHLPYFTNDRRIISGTETTVGDYVNDLIGYQKATKMRNTYVGEEGRTEEQHDLVGQAFELEREVPATGFWKYLSPAGKVHPSYMLHRTNTGRSASADPNGQNIPNRGSWAKQYKEIFVPSREGWSLVSCDLSQIELRLVAWTSGDPTMLDIYRRGGDIHAMTAAAVLGVTYEEFISWKGSDVLLRDVVGQVPGVESFLRTLQPADRVKTTLGDFYAQKRFQAKAINFGFIYGMSAVPGFIVYAKTEYGIDYTEQECHDIRRNFFDTYWGLVTWHGTMHRFAEKHGYVRALHGSIRHLPGIRSEDSGIRAAAKRYAVNSPIQRFGSDLGVIAMNRFARQAPYDIRLNGFVHDALYLEAPEERAEEAASALKWVMENPPLQEWFGIEPPLPIVSDAEIDGKERPDIMSVRPEWWQDDEDAVDAVYLQINRSALLSQAA